MKINQAFFQKPTPQVAQKLLGAELQTTVRGKTCSGIIVETEAYVGGDLDPACHCSHSRTPRNEVMFHQGGVCYVYFIYGMYHCVNVVTEKEDKGAAVLIRALEPLQGIEFMKKRRKLKGKIHNLTNGPGKVCQALAIDKKMLDENYLSSKLIRIKAHQAVQKKDICCSERIGISKAKELKWRFYIKGNPWVSK